MIIRKRSREKLEEGKVGGTRDDNWHTEDLKNPPYLFNLETIESFQVGSSHSEGRSLLRILRKEDITNHRHDVGRRVPGNQFGPS